MPKAILKAAAVATHDWYTTSAFELRGRITEAAENAS